MPSGIQPLVPAEGLVTRVLDTRKTSALGAHQTLTVALAGEQAGAGIPATATGVLGNLTVVHASSPGFVTVFPAGGSRPLASSINFDTYQSAYANHLLIKLGAGGKASVYNGSDNPIHVLLDVSGYVTGGASSAPGSTRALSPARVLDTGTGVGARKAPLAAGARLDVQLSGRGGVPASGVAGVWIEVTVASPGERGFLVAWPAGTTRPLASTVNFAAGQTVANQVFVPINAAGKASFENRSSGSLRLVGDVVGYTPTGAVASEGGMAAIPPRRVLDTGAGVGAPVKAVGSRKTVTVQVAGRAGVPLTGVRAVLLNVTATSAQAPGFLSLYAGHYCTPKGMSTLNFAPGRAIANMVLAPLAPDGTVTLFNGSDGTVRIIADVSAYVLGPRAPAGALSVASGAVVDSPLSISDDARYVGVGNYVWDSATRATSIMTRQLSSRTPPYCDYFETPLSEGRGELSGDGRMLLYSHPPDWETGWRMYLVNRAAGTSQPITDQPVSSSSITDDGSYVAYAPYQGTIDFWTEPRQLIRWNRSTGQPQVIAQVPEGQSVRGSRISGDGGTVIYEVGDDSGGSGPFDLYRWRGGQSTKIGEGSIHDLSDDGNTLLLTTSSGLIRWANGTPSVLAPPPASGGVINLARLSGDGRVAVWQRQETSDQDGPASVHRKEVGTVAVQILSYPSGSKATGIALSDDGARLAYAEQDHPTDGWLHGAGVFLR